jgi:hypothetical protein
MKYMYLCAASPDDVVRKEELDLLVELYSHILRTNLMPNLTLELFFTVELLLTESPLKEEEENYRKPMVFMFS